MADHLAQAMVRASENDLARLLEQLADLFDFSPESTDGQVVAYVLVDALACGVRTGVLEAQAAMIEAGVDSRSAGASYPA